MIRYIIPAAIALLITSPAYAYCTNADGMPCIGQELDQYNAQQKQQQQLQDQLQDIQNNQYQIENQLNQLQSEQDGN